MEQRDPQISPRSGRPAGALFRKSKRLTFVTAAFNPLAVQGPHRAALVGDRPLLAQTTVGVPYRLQYLKAYRPNAATFIRNTQSGNPIASKVDRRKPRVAGHKYFGTVVQSAWRSIIRSISKWFSTTALEFSNSRYLLIATVLARASSILTDKTITTTASALIIHVIRSRIMLYPTFFVVLRVNSI
jgi:hypothetical protein